MPRTPLPPPGLHLGLVPEQAAARHAGTTITLDHDMAALPGAGRELTYAQLAEHVEDMAARLRAAGVLAGEHLAVHKTAGFDIYVLACAACRIGAVPVLLSPQLDPDTVTALLARLPRPHLLTDAATLAGPLAGTLTGDLVGRVVTAGPVPGTAPPGTLGLPELAGAPRRPPVLAHSSRPALLTHTSGTTGLPKLVVHTAASLYGRLVPQRRLAALIRGRETYAAHLSYVHSRMYLALAVALPKGMPVVVLDDPDPAHVAEVFARTRPGVVETHPNSYVAWAELARDPRGPLAGVTCFSSTFDALHPPTMRTLLAASRRRRPVFAQFYGQSECGPLTCRLYTRGTVLTADGRCLGFPLPGSTRVRLVTDDGRPATRARPGRIEVRSRGRALTYFAEPGRYAEQTDGAWWRTGDVGYRTRFGCLHLLDREADVIPAVESTLEVEDAVMGRLAELTEVVLVPGPRQEPVPVVCVRDDAPLDRARWARAVADQPALAEPVQLTLDQLPRTATMKVRRHALVAMLRERAAQEVS
ncbi:class I adenylate-forming enzyme family protein [Streptomyces gamaensis]|uniref:Class I adenylate-forming enzyme family protein n=1 Tax=Streptomyces gamaensis TaxID=1763542 RepID=A0ABW0Z464_9ACTN